MLNDNRLVAWFTNQLLYTLYGNVDIILDHLARIHQLCATLHAPCDVFYLVPGLVGC